MAKQERDGRRVKRDSRVGQRTPYLGYYIIITDTKETEENYILGLRDTIPKEYKNRIAIIVKKEKTKDLVNEAMEHISTCSQYRETWIVFDRDQVQDFNSIIEVAKENGINVGWTNPCIEEWFHAYFGVMPNYSDSVSCCEGFEKLFKKKVNQSYNKNDKRIYTKLITYGDEGSAIKLAQQKLEDHERNGRQKPSEMCPATTLHLLIAEIKRKTQ